MSAGRDLRDDARAAHEADEHSVPCRDCGAAQWIACERPYWDDDQHPHRARIVDAVLAVVLPRIRAEKAKAWREDFYAAADAVLAAWGWNAANGFPGDVNPYRAASTGEGDL